MWKKAVVVQEVSLAPRVVLDDRHRLKLEEEGVSGGNDREAFPWVTGRSRRIGNHRTHHQTHKHMVDGLSHKGRIEVVTDGLIRNLLFKVGEEHTSSHFTWRRLQVRLE